ncbi:ABC transporter permease [Spiroplasma sp. BIUS-1]|uniref:ABC transporter permease n=1 Tax=Spiroplasma sp. BIUS-1 TaxID=216964 RepID=UPI0013979519|nr:ABC transporter permease [Spiroplasma sp. BIUS-1]QHX36913.1 ABC transporter permease [Spiroplasma sp. BIUS-1]
MKNIFKSYMKAFIKAWVETLGTIVFLMIFTMLIFGMLSTPLQLSLKATDVKRQTNFWQQQWQSAGWLDEEFVEKLILENKSVNFEYEGMNFEIKKPDGGWLTKETLQLVEDYAEETVNEQTGVNESNKPELIRQEKVSAAKDLIWLYENQGDETTTSRFKTTQTPNRVLTISNIYTPDAKNEISMSKEIGYTNRSFKNYIAFNMLEQLKQQSEETFKYELFINSNIKMDKSIGASEQFTYNMSSATSLSGTDEFNINNVVLQSGRLPKENNEIVVSDAYAKKQNKKIGDKISLGVNKSFEGSPKPGKTEEFTVVGIGLKYSALTPVGFSSFKDSIDDYAQIFFKNTFFTDSSSKYSYKQIFEPDDFKYDAKSGFYLNTWTEVFITKNDRQYNLNELFTKTYTSNSNNKDSNEFSLFRPGTTLFKAAKSYTTIDKLTSLYIITWIYVVIGSILFILGFMFILFVLKKEINNTRKQLGVFKSLGYTTKELTWVFAVKTFLTMIIGIGIGYLLSFPFQIDSATKQFSTFVIFDFSVIYASPVFLMVLTIIVPLLFAGLSYLIIFKFLNEGALSLLTVGPKKSKADKLVLVLKIIFFPALIYSLINWLVLRSLRKRNKGFTFRMQHAFVSAGKGKFALIMGLFIFSSFLFTLQLRAMPVIKNMIEGGYNIYTKEVNHLYDLNSVVPVNAKNGKISQDIKKENYGIKFTNIDEDKNQSVENYVRNNQEYEATNNFSEVMTLIADKRKVSLDKPLENLVQSGKLYLEAIDTDLGKGTKIANATPENMPGLFLNDFGKLACISPIGLMGDKPYMGSCNDVESFKPYLFDFLNGLQSGQTKLSNKINPFPANDAFFTLLSTFSKMKEGVNPLLSVNNILFNGNQEALQTSLSYHVEGNSDVDISNSLIKFIDTTNKIGGNTREIVNFDSISDKQMNELSEVNGDHLNAIISFRLSKILNKEIGDTFDIVVGKDVKVKIRVAAINANDTLMQDIYTDYTASIKLINGEDKFDENKLLFNTLISNKKASEGIIDLTNIAASMNSFTYSRDTYAMASSPNSPWLASIMIPMTPKPKASTLFMDPSVITLPILKSVIDQVLGKMTNAMLMYILIDVVLLIILLIVIMNIIITDSINVITIMRSLGYTNGQINWMVMGKYVSGAAISYIFAFIASIGVWHFIQSFVWARFTVLIALPSLPWIPFVSAIILGAILYIGWMAAMLQIKKRPLTLLVS